MRTIKAAVSLLCLLITACTGEAVSNYCNDHQIDHAEHQQDIAKLVVLYTGEGSVEVTVTAPINKLGNDIDALKQVDNVIAMQGQQACELIASNVSQDGAVAKARYQLDCGQDKNSLKQVDVKLLDTFSAIEEVEADITMPAVRKFFAINRQCEKPIFKL
ncbi:hypothetical protein [Oceanicoccus sp. KOV_DT_Chl]|uniref:hypothetical protein n=1 Tax=Oceanicoccus sp. KOV_DT_Chl TaxID=1904639 RepID=UPI000C7BE084|nr:hypothetical protein [Oceanicoccus sp. KOV_DT_Chl]